MRANGGGGSWDTLEAPGGSAEEQAAMIAAYLAAVPSATAAVPAISATAVLPVTNGTSNGPSSVGSVSDVGNGSASVTSPAPRSTAGSSSTTSRKQNCRALPAVYTIR